MYPITFLSNCINEVGWGVVTSVEGGGGLKFIHSLVRQCLWYSSVHLGNRNLKERTRTCKRAGYPHPFLTMGGGGGMAEQTHLDASLYNCPHCIFAPHTAHVRCCYIAASFSMRPICSFCAGLCNNIDVKRTVALLCIPSENSDNKGMIKIRRCDVKRRMFEHRVKTYHPKTV